MLLLDFFTRIHLNQNYFTLMRHKRFPGYGMQARFLRIVAVLVMLSTQVFAKSFAQSITYSGKDVSLPQIFSVIKKQTGYVTFYSAELIKNTKPVTVSVKDVSLNSFLATVLKDQDLEFSLSEKTIMLSKRVKQGIAASAAVAQDDTSKPRTVHGKIVNEDGASVEDALIMVANGKYHTNSNDKGEFTLTIPSKEKILLVSRTNFNPSVISLKNSVSNYPVVLRIKSEAGITVSTGMFTRKKESFTGATATFTGEELKRVGTQNIVQSLKTLDPSFIVMESNAGGSNPNQPPVVQMRGATVLDQYSGYNSPLCVLDGFVVSFQTIIDMDMNRIASVTLLKDASSAAMYGSQAANGVIVVETKKPTAGKLKISYSGEVGVQAPDLTSYNMMNSSEELQFEKLAGRYKAATGSIQQDGLDILYNKYLANVQQGVNTYWMSVPLQTGISNGHSVYVEGGDTTVRVGFSARYKNVDGVMKGSNRTTWGASSDISYRKKNTIFSNKLFVDGTNANNSPYGSFDTWVNTPTYFPKNTTQRLLDESQYVTNPLYDATIAQKYNINNSKGLSVTDNLQLTTRLNPYLQAVGNFSISGNTGTGIVFQSPDMTAFMNKDYTQKGSYINSKSTSFNYAANAGLTYGRVFSKVHSLTANVRAEVAENRSTFLSMQAVGFPSGSNGSPAYAYGYTPNSKPGYSTSVNRRMNIVGSANYVYDRRYFVDATYRLDGATTFGVDNPTKSFYALGVGWNLQNEAFLKNITWLNTLRVSANTGITSNLSYNALTTGTTTYVYNPDISMFGQGVYMSSLANPDLKWQITTQNNFGAYLLMFHNRLSIDGNFYIKTTDPMTIALALPGSTGISSYAMNVGRLQTKGVDLNVRYMIINDAVNRKSWSVGVTYGAYSSVLSGMGNAADQLNQKFQGNSNVNNYTNSFTRYKDGYSPDDLWAVKSMGIDPGTGNEVFQKLDGKYTYTYDANDAIRIGNGHPKGQGVVNTTVRWKGFTASLNFRYSFGQNIYNSALFNKVENINTFNITSNHDRRALYGRWQQPGDIVPFRNINILDANNPSTFTPVSSRFIQNQNYFSGESLSLGYEVLNKKVLKTLGLQSLRCSAITNDLFYLGTVLRERGTSYPYAHNYTFTFSAMF
jgi:TonB-linked SusC/RagA family outer membrane protein